MKSETVFEIINVMKKEIGAWDELLKQCDSARKAASLSTLEELESRLREKLKTLNEPIVCGCGLLLNDSETYEKHKSFCGVANR